MIKRCVVAAIVTALFFITRPALGATAEFQSFMKSNSSVKIYVDIKNTSGDDKVDVNLVKKLLEEAFAARRSHSFTIVQTAEGADLILKGDVTEYIWMKEDPVDQVYGIGPAAIDVVMLENYARVQVQAAIVTAKNNRTLWSDRVKATVTKDAMPKESSYDLIYPKFIKSIMIEIFRKRTTDTI